MTTALMLLLAGLSFGAVDCRDRAARDKFLEVSPDAPLEVRQKIAELWLLSYRAEAAVEPLRPEMDDQLRRMLEDLLEFVFVISDAMKGEYAALRDMSRRLMPEKSYAELSAAIERNPNAALQNLRQRMLARDDAHITTYLPEEAYAYAAFLDRVALRLCLAAVQRDEESKPK